MSIYNGVVGLGTSRALGLGFPTANIPLQDAELSGVYAGVVTFAGVEYPAMLYADQKHSVLESHLLDFSDDLYGKKIEVRVLAKIRESKKFPDDMAPAELMTDDLQKVRAYFAKGEYNSAS
jgi:riboflavin kinase/FMN adenylyltransferase